MKTINRRIPLPGENHEQNIEEDGGMVYGGHEGQWNAKGFCHREQVGGNKPAGVEARQALATRHSSTSAVL